MGAWFCSTMSQRLRIFLAYHFTMRDFVFSRFHFSLVPEGSCSSCHRDGIPVNRKRARTDISTLSLGKDSKSFILLLITQLGST